MTHNNTVEWLQQFGYFEHEDDPQEAVRRMQKVYQLEPDGVLGDVTKNAMQVSRCACPDTGLGGPGNAILGDDPNRRWKKDVVKYSIGWNFRLANDRDRTLEIIEAGFKIYEPLTGLRFELVQSFREADIQIARGSGKKWKFDGPGKVLARADLPGQRPDGKVHMVFDAAEPWNLGITGPGVSVQAVWMHELGHAVGLTHSDNPADLMAPYYNPRILVPQAGDRQRLANLYDVTVDPVANPVKLADSICAEGFRPGSYRVSGSMVVKDSGDGFIYLDDVKSA